MTPTRIDLWSVSYYAEQIAKNAHAAYWLECSGTGAKDKRKDMLGSLEKLATLFGMELVEADDDEPEPLDAETIAAREECTERQIIDAGRGHLVQP